MRSLFVLVLLLGACTAQQATLVDVSIGKIRDGHDTTAKGLIAGVCAMSLGAYYRLENPLQARGASMMCGGEGSTPVTIEGLADFLEDRSIQP